MHASVLVWFRRDLRDVDHAALAQALRRARRVFCAFVFDTDILDALEKRADRRVDFIRASLVELDGALRARGGALIVRHGRAVDEIPALARQLGVEAVFANRDYEPPAKARDAAIAAALQTIGVGFEAFKDQVILDGVEVLTAAGRPFAVFTPYRRAWLKRAGDDDFARHDSEGGAGELAPTPLANGVPTLAAIGFGETDLQRWQIEPGMRGARARLDDFRRRIDAYAATRDFPAAAGGSGLSMHLRFGTVSIRQACALAIGAGALAEGAEGGEGGEGDGQVGKDAAPRGAAVWLGELIWREFFFMILDHFPHVAGGAFRREFDALQWERGAAADAHFEAWCAGRTGYPLIDAAMRELSASGAMPNRLRMVSASFLIKDLGIDWRRGEAWFAARLNDFDLAANNGGWQWAASTGCDAQPYFRIFNPLTQSERFDKDGRYIRRWLPELAGVPDRFLHAPTRMGGEKPLAPAYPAPIVEHAAARRAALARYARVSVGAGRLSAT